MPGSHELIVVPHTGSTFPLRVISPVIAVSERTSRPANSEVRTVAMVTPADGPSFSTAPAGKWTCISVLSKLLQSRPYYQKKWRQRDRDRERVWCV